MHRTARAAGLRRVIALLGGMTLAVAQLLGAAAPAAASTFIAGSCAASSTLIPFMEAANDESLYPGGDTINLKAGCTYIVSAAQASTEFALPPITSDITIVGHGARIELLDGAEARSLFAVRNGASLILADVTLAEAVGSGSLGASIHNNGDTTLSNVTITHSVPFGQGGPAVYNSDQGAVAIISSTIENQSCGLCGAAGIRNVGSLTVTDSTLARNTVAAAISNAGTAAIYGSTFSANTSSAISNAGFLEVHDSSFTGNQDQVYGGAIRNAGAADLVVEGSYFAGNDVNGEGGAIFNGPESIARIVNSTFYENTAASPWYSCCVGGAGGAIANHHALRLEHVTFQRNGAGEGASVASPEGAAVVYASVFDLPRGAGHCDGTIVDIGGNVVDTLGSGCPGTFAVGDPKLGAPRVNGSGTRTIAFGADSAAFDAVPTTECAAFDQRGVARPVGAACDSGAFEDQRPGVPGAPALLSGATPNVGTFVLAWTAATDPDGVAPGYVLYRRDADDAHYTQVATPASASSGLTAEPEGTLRYAVAANDGNLQSARSADSAPIVVDRTPPSAPSRAADRSPEGGNWFRDSVTVSFSGSADPDLPDGSAGSGVAFITAPITTSTSGIHSLAGIARDVAGNESPATTATVRVDAEDPVVGFDGCPRDVFLGSADAASWSASDASSGVAGATSGSVPLDTGSLGTRTASVAVTDLVGHQATASCTYRVIYDFGGFYNPLASAPTFVDARAGDTLAVVFSLGGDQGLEVIATGSPVSAPISCTAPSDPGSGEATTEGRPLGFQKAHGGRYRYDWVTSRAWKASCRQLILTLVDGTTHRANVRFR